MASGGEWWRAAVSGGERGRAAASGGERGVPSQEEEAVDD